jgi:hypothetical protein
MRTRVLTTALLLWGGVRLTDAPGEPPEKAKEEAGPIEIDFSLLPDRKKDEKPPKYELTIAVNSKDGPTYQHSFMVNGLHLEELRNQVKVSLEREDWTATAVDEKKLVVESYKGSPVTTVEIKVEGEGVKESMTPTVKRVKQDKAKDEAGPVEIDFSPLPDRKKGDEPIRFEVTIVLESKDGPTHKFPFTIFGLPTEVVRNHIKNDLELNDWVVRPVGDKKLVVESYKGSPVTTVEIKVDGIKESMTPTVERVKEDKKEDKK